jgi:hypothetical protein
MVNPVVGLIYGIETWNVRGMGKNKANNVGERIISGDM